MISDMSDQQQQKLGVGFIGAGWMGATLMKRLAERGDAVILGLHQRNRERAEVVLTDLGLDPSIFTDRFEDILENAGEMFY